MRLFGLAPKTGQDYVRRPGAYAILQAGDQVLLTFQDGPDPEFQIPGGGIDPGETPRQALQREVLEETGWRISQIRRVGMFRRFVFMPDYDMFAEKICHIYTARPCFQVCDPLEPMHSVVWTSLVAARDIVANPGDRHFLNIAAD